MIKKSQIKFIIYFCVSFVILFSLMYSAGLVPESIKPNDGESFLTLWDKISNKAGDRKSGSDVRVGESPIRIVIEKIGVDAIVSNPNTTNIATLDEYLKQGAVRYPGSGLSGVGNMFIFGHSTGRAVVVNQAYKTFNGLKDLVKGDIIKVYGKDKIYDYRVSSVSVVDQSQALVEFGNKKDMLTLSSCNSFGSKDNRYVVEAEYILN